MKNYRIEFIHKNSEYVFVGALDNEQPRVYLISACRNEVRAYMDKHNLKGEYVLTGMKVV